jgi:ketosteroid isomerase-like protein
MFDCVFSSFKSCDIDFLEEDVRINSDIGAVCTVQRVDIVLKSGETQALVRQTDSFERRGDKWKLIHEHASFPAVGGLGR